MSMTCAVGSGSTSSVASTSMLTETNFRSAGQRTLGVAVIERITGAVVSAGGGGGGGSSSSTTVTWKLRTVKLWRSSFASQITSVVPIGKSDPEDGEQ